MIPRYRPCLRVSTVARWWRVTPEDTRAARGRLLQTLDDGSGAREPYVFERARHALHAVFLDVARQADGPGSVLMPAQICAIVPAVARAAGLVVRFADSDSAYPTSGPAQLVDALHDDVRAVVIAPMYGHLPAGWSALVETLARRRARVVLDFAQGVLLRDTVDPALFEAADDVIYSFGLGKGADTGGALLLTGLRSGFDGHVSGGRSVCVAELARNVALRALIAAGAYRLLLRRIEAALESASEAYVVTPPRSAHADLFWLWDAAVRELKGDIVRARDRAARIARCEAVRRVCRDVSVFCSERATHLRQVLRLREAAIRDDVVATLRRRGIDCSPAGEPLPDAIAGLGARASAAFSNAQAFTRDAIRLPFLGRMPDEDFERVADALRETLGELSR